MSIFDRSERMATLADELLADLEDEEEDIEDELIASGSAGDGVLSTKAEVKMEVEDLDGKDVKVNLKNQVQSIDDVDRFVLSRLRMIHQS